MWWVEIGVPGVAVMLVQMRMRYLKVEWRERVCRMMIIMEARRAAGFRASLGYSSL